MRLRPINDNVVIEETPLADATQGGILLPDVAKDQFRQAHGTVLAAGPGKKRKDSEERIPMQVKVGDIVLYTPYSGNDVIVDGKPVKVMPESQIQLVME